MGDQTTDSSTGSPDLRRQSPLKAIQSNRIFERISLWCQSWKNVLECGDLSPVCRRSATTEDGLLTKSANEQLDFSR